MFWEFLSQGHDDVLELFRELWPLIPVSIIYKLGTMKPHSITVRLGPELKAKLTTCAKKLDLSENDIAKHAVRAAVSYVEANDYRIGPPFKIMYNGPLDSEVPTSDLRISGTPPQRKTSRTTQIIK